LAHKTLGCSGISRSDFRFDDSKPGTKGLYFLEINTQPGFTPISLLPEQAERAGISFGALCDWLVKEARCHA
jgi:D-alanine-D-alanine ligase